MMENLTLKTAMALAKSGSTQDRAKGLRLLALLLRRGVSLTPEAVHIVANSLEDMAGMMPVTAKKGGRPKSASSFMGFVTHVLMQELGLTESKAVGLLLDYANNHKKNLPDASTIRKMRVRYKGMLVCEPESLESVRRILTWAKAQRDTA